MFIQVTDAEDKESVYVNVDSIVSVKYRAEVPLLELSGVTQIRTIDNGVIFVEEGYYEVKNHIQQALKGRK